MSYPAPLPDPEWYESALGAQTQALFTSSLGNLYFASIAEVGVAEATGNLQIWKSSDAGNTWARIVDDANNSNGLNFNAVQDGDKIRFVVGDPLVSLSGNLAVCTFDMGTDAFLTPDLGGPSGGYAAPVGKFSDGTLILFYNTHNNTPGNLNYVTWKEGTGWGAEITIASGVYHKPEWVAVENHTDRAHVFLNDLSGNQSFTGGSSIGDLWHVSVDSSGTVGTMQQLTATGLFQYGLDSGHPIVLSDDSQIHFPHTIQTVAYDGVAGGSKSAPSATLGVFRGTVAADPVWTQETASTFAPATGAFSMGFFWYATWQGEAGGVSVILFSVVTVPSFPANTTGALYETHSSSPSGGWSTPQQIFNVPMGSEVLNMYAANTDANTLGIVIAAIDMALFIGTGTKYSALGVWYLQLVEGSPVVIQRIVRPPRIIPTGCFIHPHD